MNECICCICGRKVKEWGNDPWPVMLDDDAKCCNKCDMEVVLPARMNLMEAKEDE